MNDTSTCDHCKVTVLKTSLRFCEGCQMFLCRLCQGPHDALVESERERHMNPVEYARKAEIAKLAEEKKLILLALKTAAGYYEQQARSLRRWASDRRTAGGDTGAPGQTIEVLEGQAADFDALAAELEKRS